MQWLQKFMMGRYGADQLNLALIVLALVLSIVFSIVPLGLIGTLIAMIPLVLAVVRMLSRNRTKRAQENLAFLKLWNPVRNWFQWLYLSIRYCKKNRYFLCPGQGICLGPRAFVCFKCSPGSFAERRRFRPAARPGPRPCC